jgi:cellulose synthase/poly-beta-1,6-N-acetylglucosamine synthase-like glycosyltransferase
MSNPQISVVLPIHNGMPYLPDTIQSVLEQSFRDFELIALDDGSTDETWSYLQAQDDPRLRAIRLEKVGLVGALNRALDEAKAPLIARIDADDIALPNRLAAQHQFMAERPKVALLGCQALCIDERGSPSGTRRFPLSSGAIRFQMFFGCPFLHPGTMFRRGAAMDIGGYRKEYFPGEDYDLWSRLIVRHQTANHCEPLMRYRVHSQSITGTQASVLTEMCGKIASDYAARIGCGADPQAVKQLYLFLAAGLSMDMEHARQLRDAYVQIKNFCGAQDAAADAELLVIRDAIQRRLRWLCLERMQATHRRPVEAFAWLRLAGSFDREQGSVGKIVRRGLVGLIRRWTGDSGSRLPCATHPAVKF